MARNVRVTSISYEGAGGPEAVERARAAGVEWLERAAPDQLDFGRVGCAICFDLNFRDVAEGLVATGAEILFFPSMYRGGLQLRIWAHDFGRFILSATPGEGSALVDPLGRVLVESSRYQRLF